MTLSNLNPIMGKMKQLSNNFDCFFRTFKLPMVTVQKPEFYQPCFFFFLRSLLLLFFSSATENLRKYSTKRDQLRMMKRGEKEREKKLKEKRTHKETNKQCDKKFVILPTAQNIKPVTLFPPKALYCCQKIILLLFRILFKLTNFAPKNLIKYFGGLESDFFEFVEI